MKMKTVSTNSPAQCGVLKTYGTETKELSVNDFAYDLPSEFIAQTPLNKRDQSKMLVYNRAENEYRITQFFDIINFLKKGDVVVINNTKVMPARLVGRKSLTGAKIELLIFKKLSADTYATLVKPLKRVKTGDNVLFERNLTATLVSKDETAGTAVVRFNTEVDEAVLSGIGEVPLPHYITEKLAQSDRYQTVYARESGSVAAPTAGLHWTQELISAAKAKGVIFAEILLHVGLGTFKPVQTEDITKHKMHSEYYEIPDAAIAAINSAKSESRRVICVGTTSLRAVESYARTGKTCGETDIFIYPPFEFKIASGLVTNFHLPKSTLIMLVSAFAGRAKVLELYEIAKASGFRFYSFGDCMFIV